MHRDGHILYKMHYICIPYTIHYICVPYTMHYIEQTPMVSGCCWAGTRETRLAQTKKKPCSDLGVHHDGNELLAVTIRSRSIGINSGMTTRWCFFALRIHMRSILHYLAIAQTALTPAYCWTGAREIRLAYRKETLRHYNDDLVAVTIP